MFISWKYSQYLGKKDGKHTWEYELTDSEFGAVIGVTNSIEIASVVIEEYSKRNLNVAKNLALVLIWEHEQNSWRPIQHIIDNNREFNPLFPQYEEEVQKYLQKYMVLL
jgi:hypothetical protein